MVDGGWMTCASRSSLRSAHESPDSAIRKRDSDLEAQDLYSKFYRYKLEMFNFPNHPGKFGNYQMQSYFR